MVALEQTRVLVISVWTETGEDVAVTFRARIRWSPDSSHSNGQTVVATPEDVLAVVRMDGRIRRKRRLTRARVAG